MISTLPILIGWILDLILGDPQWLPHPVVWFGKMISFGEHKLNHGKHRKLKGAIMSVTLILIVFFITFLLRSLIELVELNNFSSSDIRNINWLCRAKGSSLFTLHSSLIIIFDTIIVFYCLAGTTLIREVRAVFLALDRSLDEGRKQVARIVGRDTSELSAQEVRTAALETLSENLSDGVIAPLFWFAILGTPGMLAYKMANTLDSMIGYRTDRYKDFGCWAARIDDITNYIPARLTALLMILPRMLFSLRFSLFSFVLKNGRNHASPNSGYPEAALAGILDCRFGGPHYYFGELFDKPYIGKNDRPLTTADMKTAVYVNRTAEVLMLILVIFIIYFTKA